MPGQPDWEYASTSCQTSYGFATSSGPMFAGGFSYGEVLITTFLFMLLVLNIYKFMWGWLRGFKIKQHGL